MNQCPNSPPIQRCEAFTKREFDHGLPLLVSSWRSISRSRGIVPSSDTDAIDKVYPRGDGVSRELYARLKNYPWLATRQGPVRPDDVIHLPGMEDRIVKLLAEPEGSGGVRG